MKKTTAILGQQVSQWTTLADDERTTCLQDGHTRAVDTGIEVRAEVIFIVGLPGSGKTTMINVLGALLKQQGRNVIYCDDYSLLFAKAAREQRSGQNLARPAQFCQLLDEDGKMRGFTVEKGVVLEQVLCEINERICQYLYQPNTVILVEFARGQYLYERVWQHFCHEVRMNARYVFCDADFAVCVERVQRRRQRIDLEVMYTHYQQDGLFSLMQNCNLDRIDVFCTDRTMQETIKQVARFLEKLSRVEFFTARRADTWETREDYRESSFRIIMEGEGKVVASL